MFTFGTFQQCTLIFIVSTFYILQAPFSKVEESFSMQAIHDFLYLSSPKTLPISISSLFHNSTTDKSISSTSAIQWDHETFPGVVHRSFIPSAIVAALTKVFQAKFEAKFTLQIISRIVLHLFFLLSYSRFLESVSKIHGKQITKWISLLFVTQFHFLFYSSRTLPNTFALILVLFAYADWIEQRFSRLIPIIAFTVVAIRFETIILFGAILLTELFHRRIGFLTILAIGIPAGILSLGVTVGFDSVIWGKWLWPEGDGILFNIIENKSHEFGTSPFLWYFYSALPRLGLFSLGFLILVPHFSKYTFVSLLFVFLYSVLPHKELRFIIYVAPLMNLCIAQSISKLWNRFAPKVKAEEEDGDEKDKRKDDNPPNESFSLFDLALKTFIVLTLTANLLATGLFFRMSSQNYPGGVAIHAVNDAVRADLTKSQEIAVYVSNLAAQTGFTRFLEVENIHYNKEPKFLKNNFKTFSAIYLILEVADEKKYFNQCTSKSLCNLTIGEKKHSCNWIQNITAFDRFDLKSFRIFYKTFLNIYRCSVPEAV